MKEIIITFVIIIFLTACQPQPANPTTTANSISTPTTVNAKSTITNLQPSFPTHPPYQPGELVDYIAQTGDTLPALTSHFNSTTAEIMKANPAIPASVTTLPPGFPMKIPIYYAPFWGSPYQILPDSLFINGPAQIGFNTQEFISKYPGWLNSASDYVGGYARSGAQIIDTVALNFSVSPRLLLAILEFTSGALSQTTLASDMETYPLGYVDREHNGLYLQLVWAANTLNNGYYGWRNGKISTMELLNGRIERPDPWQNAGTVGLQYLFSRLLDPEEYAQAISSEGIAKVYDILFGDPWQDIQPHIPGSLTQPTLSLPFEPKLSWAFTGGPHTGWGEGEPLAALDFAPPAVVGGCVPTEEWATAVAPGVIVRSEPAIVVLDLDGDGDEHTGWVIFYLHLATDGRARAGLKLNTGDPVGHPSCEGGRSTGTHVHIARKYNGEWIPADGPLAFNMEGWIAKNGDHPYQGTLTRFSRTIIACLCADQKSQLQSKTTP